MACYTPLKAYRAPGGGVVFNAKDGYSDRHLELACGQCIGCRIDRSQAWALRCVHEAQLHEKNSFLTLTYDSTNVPLDGSLRVEHWQKFAKRLRKRLGGFRFFHCGEYGDSNFRPHYHACLFGLDFSEDRRLLKKSGKNELFTSPTLDAAWGMGHAVIGHLTRESAAYVARYVIKKKTGPQAAEQYRRIDTETGEEYFVKPEYVTMSRRPGIGSEWFKKFASDVYPSDEVVHDGKKFRPPKFYDRELEKERPETLEAMKSKRRRAAAKHKTNNTPERLEVRETVTRSKLDQLKRNL